MPYAYNCIQKYRQYYCILTACGNNRQDPTRFCKASSALPKHWQKPRVSRMISGCPCATCKYMKPINAWKWWLTSELDSGLGPVTHHLPIKNLMTDFGDSASNTLEIQVSEDSWMSLSRNTFPKVWFLKCPIGIGQVGQTWDALGHNTVGPIGLSFPCWTQAKRWNHWRITNAFGPSQMQVGEGQTFAGFEWRSPLQIPMAKQCIRKEWEEFWNVTINSFRNLRNQNVIFIYSILWKEHIPTWTIRGGHDENNASSVLQ